MPAVTVSSRGTNVVLDDDEAQAEALTALRECDRQLDDWEASGRRDDAAVRMAVSLFSYAEMLLEQLADE